MALALCALVFSACGETADKIRPEENETVPVTDEGNWDQCPAVMVNGKLYYDIGRFNDDVSRCGMMDGQISSSVESWETPSQDDQSNFGSGYSYQYGAEDTIEVYMNGHWKVIDTN